MEARPLRAEGTPASLIPMSGPQSAPEPARPRPC